VERGWGVSSKDTVGGYRGSGDATTMRPPAPLPSGSMGKPTGRPDPTATLTPTQALTDAARLNVAAMRALDGEHPEQAAVMAQVALSLTAYATTAGRWQGR